MHFIPLTCRVAYNCAFVFRLAAGMLERSTVVVEWGVGYLLLHEDLFNIGQLVRKQSLFGWKATVGL